MNVQSREKRAKVTEQIRGTLITLVEKEKDFEKKKKHPATWYRNQVAEQLNIQESNNPSLRSYEEALKPIRKKFQVKNPLDNPWTIGSCIKYDIPSDIIPLLIEYRRDISQVNTPVGKRDLAKTRLSIRKARWMAKLYPIAIDKLKTQFPDDPLKQMAFLSSICDEYTRREVTAEILERPLDTYDLDTLLFVREDLTPDDAILSALLSTFTPEEFDNFKILLKKTDNVNLSDTLYKLSQTIKDVE